MLYLQGKKGAIQLKEVLTVQTLLFQDNLANFPN